LLLVVRRLPLQRVVRAAAGGAAFQHGSRIQQFVETSRGTFEFIAKVGIEGKNLTLNNISWFHVTDEGRVPLGYTEPRALIMQFAQQVKSAGFERVAWAEEAA
jgi:hypothetical protein